MKIKSSPSSVCDTCLDSGEVLPDAHMTPVPLASGNQLRKYNPIPCPACFPGQIPDPVDQGNWKTDYQDFLDQENDWID